MQFVLSSATRWGGDDAVRCIYQYSRKDSEFALKLTADLERRGINVWIDQGDIVAAIFDWRIVSAIQVSECAALE